MTDNAHMYTVVEIAIFEKLWPNYWTQAEHDEFADYIAANPNAGDVVSGSGGVRKVRWARTGSGKSGGVRVIYFNRLANGEIWLIFMYAKSKLDAIAGKALKEMKDEIEKTID